MTGAEAKAEARRAAFARRKAAFATGQGAAADHLAAALAPHAGQVLAGYMPMRTEIDPLAAMAAHVGPVCVPVILGPGHPLGFRRWLPDTVMVPGDFGALIPETGDWLEPEVLIVPLVAFDARGYRLGYGGGFYDRTLERLRARLPILAIGFAFAAQECDAVPIEPTDQPLDLIVTEDGPRRPRR
ncbi:MAG: 5-formyltetrahydrofolate cyclo-ligase [Rhodobacteraceae bacterium]|nr:5-formyltetrahydrofolate cyclo-ligase [Paracoccaceae bacterium]